MNFMHFVPKRFQSQLTEPITMLNNAQFSSPDQIG